MFRTYRVAALLQLAVLVSGCDSDSATSVPPSLASITLFSSSAGDLTARGDTRFITAVAYGTGGDIVSLPPLTWTSDAPNVATVSGTGVAAEVTAISDGTAQITASGGGTYGRLTVRVHRAVAEVRITAPSPTLTIGSSAALVATALDAAHAPIAEITDFTYTSSAPGSVLVSPDGVATALFDLLGSTAALVKATLHRDGEVFTDTVRVRVVAPQPHDILALLLGSSVRPVPVLTTGQGAGYLQTAVSRISYVVTWSDLSGPATAVHLHGSADANGVGEVLVDLPLATQHALYGTVSHAIVAGDIIGQGGRPPISLAELAALVGDARVYVDVHTALHPEGEIRGTLILRLDPGIS